MKTDCQVHTDFNDWTLGTRGNCVARDLLLLTDEVNICFSSRQQADIQSVVFTVIVDVS